MAVPESFTDEMLKRVRVGFNLPRQMVARLDAEPSGAASPGRRCSRCGSAIGWTGRREGEVMRPSSGCVQQPLRTGFGIGIGMNTDHTLEEVGQQFSVTRERIRQIEAKALS